MKTLTAINYFESAVALARALDITPQAVSRWGERVPPLRQLQLHAITRGRLRPARDVFARRGNAMKKRNGKKRG